jgi:hypothetical protein
MQPCLKEFSLLEMLLYLVCELLIGSHMRSPKNVGETGSRADTVFYAQVPSHQLRVSGLQECSLRLTLLLGLTKAHSTRVIQEHGLLLRKQVTFCPFSTWEPGHTQYYCMQLV